MDSAAPRREWHVHCRDSFAEPQVCSVEANFGDVDLVLLETGFLFSLAADQIDEFRLAVDAASAQAERDRRTSRARLGGRSSPE
jgi:hypothetical protein